MSNLISDGIVDGSFFQYENVKSNLGNGFKSHAKSQLVMAFLSIKVK